MTEPDDHAPLPGGPEVVLHEERLRAGTERVAVERVLVRKVVVTETRQVEVTVRREELQTTRVPADGAPAAGPAGGPPLVVVLAQEVPVVTLHPEPYERVTVHVDTVAGEQRVEQTLSSERVELRTDPADRAP